MPKIRVESCVKYMACQIDLPHLREGAARCAAQLDTVPAVINDQVAAATIYGNFMDALIATLNHITSRRGSLLLQLLTPKEKNENQILPI